MGCTTLKVYTDYKPVWRRESSVDNYMEYPENHCPSLPCRAKSGSRDRLLQGHKETGLSVLRGRSAQLVGPGCS